MHSGNNGKDAKAVHVYPCPLQLDVQLVSACGRSGAPRARALGLLPLEFDWLANELDALRNTAQRHAAQALLGGAAAAAAASAGAHGFGHSSLGTSRGAVGHAGGVGTAAGGLGMAGQAAEDVSVHLDVALYPLEVVAAQGQQHSEAGMHTVSGRASEESEAAAQQLTPDSGSVLRVLSTSGPSRTGLSTARLRSTSMVRRLALIDKESLTLHLRISLDVAQVSACMRGTTRC